MKKTILATILIIILSIPLIASAGSPFKNSGKTVTETEKTVTGSFYFKLALYQQKLRIKLSETMKEVKNTGNILPVLPLILVAFIYGVLHAAGPGHGKALAASYLISRGKKTFDGIYVGSIIALLHGLSAIFLVLFLKFILKKSVMAPLEEITHITRIISFSLILCVGIILTIKNLYGWYLNIGIRRDLNSGKYDGRPAGSLTTALAAGIIPCPGTVLIMLFALSIDMVGTGIILAAAQTLGMALTISLVGMAVVTGKSKTLSFVDYTRRDIADILEKSIETIAGITIVIIGALLLVGTLR